MFDEQNCKPESVPNLLNKTHQVFLRGRIQTSRRFVQEQQLWLGGERAHNLQATLPAIRQAGAGFAPYIHEVKDLEQLQGEVAMVALVLIKSWQPNTASADFGVHECDRQS